MNFIATKKGASAYGILHLLYFVFITIASPVSASSVGLNWIGPYPNIPSFNAQLISTKKQRDRLQTTYIWKKGSITRFDRKQGEHIRTFVVERNKNNSRVSKIAERLNIDSHTWISPTWEYPSFDYIPVYYDITELSDNLNTRKYKASLKASAPDFAKKHYWHVFRVVVNKLNDKPIKFHRTTTKVDKNGDKVNLSTAHKWTYKTIARHGETNLITVPKSCEVTSTVHVPGRTKPIHISYNRNFVFSFESDHRLKTLRNASWPTIYRDTSND